MSHSAAMIVLPGVTCKYREIGPETVFTLGTRDVDLIGML